MVVSSLKYDPRASDVPTVFLSLSAGVGSGAGHCCDITVGGAIHQN